jgi:hypothetical protein
MTQENFATTSPYKGPKELSTDVGRALEVLAKLLTVSTAAVDSHTVLSITGFGSAPANGATAVYLVGSIAQCIGADLRLAKHFLMKHRSRGTLARMFRL